MNIGFIGAGNMARAIILGICSENLMDAHSVYASNPSSEKLRNLEAECGINTSADNKYVAELSEVLFLCVKPQKLEDVAMEIKDVIDKNAIIVSIAAGKSIKDLETMFGGERKIVRVMPNAPALTGDGICALSPNEAAENDERMQEIIDLLGGIGEVVTVDEAMIDIAGQIAGASPAWISMIIEAMADGAVHEGMPRDMAYRFAAAGVTGTGRLASKLGGNPGKIKDMVSSPKGTTIEGIRILEERGVRSAFMDAVIASCEKAKKL